LGVSEVELEMTLSIGIILYSDVVEVFKNVCFAAQA
jgi:hypothetical protein